MKDKKEICKKIAEIENLILSQEWNCSDNGVFVVGSFDEVGEVQSVYDPINNKSLCFDLMVKYSIIYCRCLDGHIAKYSDNELDYIVNENPQLAICLAIIKKASNET